MKVGGSQSGKVKKNKSPFCRKLADHPLPDNIRQWADTQGFERSMQASYQSLRDDLTDVSNIMKAWARQTEHPVQIQGVENLQTIVYELYAALNIREKFLTNGKYFKPCTTSDGQPVFDNNPEQREYLIGLIYEFAIEHDNLVNQYGDFLQNEPTSSAEAFNARSSSRSPGQWKEAKQIIPLMNQLRKAVSQIKKNRDVLSEEKPASLSSPQPKPKPIPIPPTATTMTGVLTTLKNATSAYPSTVAELRSNNGEGNTTTVLMAIDSGSFQATTSTVPVNQTISTFIVSNDTTVFPLVASKMTTQSANSTIVDILDGNFENSWAGQLENHLTTYQQVISNVSSEMTSVINQTNLVKAYLDLVSLKELIEVYGDFIGSFDAEAMAAYKSQAEGIGNQISQLDKVSKTRSKRSDTDPANTNTGTSISLEELKVSLVKSLINNLEKLIRNPYSEGFKDFCRGYIAHQKEFMANMQSDQEISSEAWSPEDQLIKQAMQSRKCDTNTFNRIMSEARTQFDANQYYEAGQQYFSVGMMSSGVVMGNPVEVSRIAMEKSNYINHLNYILKQSEPVSFSNVIDIRAWEYAAILSNPIYIKETNSEIGFGNCFATTLLQALSGDEIYMENMFTSLIMGAKYSQIPILDFNDMFQVLLAVNTANNYFQAKLGRFSKTMQETLELQYAKLRQSGCKLSSQVYKNILNDVAEIRSAFHHLNGATVDAKDLGQYLLNQFTEQKRLASIAGENFNSLKMGITTLSDSNNSGHIMRLALKEHSDDTASFYLEDSGSNLYEVRGNSLEALHAVTQGFYRMVKEVLDKRGYISDQLSVLRFTPDFLEKIASVQVLPSNSLNMNDITKTPFEDLPELEQTRNLQLSTDFFNKLVQPETYGFLFKKRSLPGVAVNQNMVTTKDPIIYQMRELLAAVAQKESAQTPIPLQTIALAGKVLKSFTEALKVINLIPDDKFSSAMSASQQEGLNHLAEALTAFRSMTTTANAAGSNRAIKSTLDSFNTEVEKYVQKIQSAEATERTPDTGQSRAQEDHSLSAKKLTQIKQVLKAAAQKTARLRSPQAADPSTASQAAIRQAEEELVSTCQDSAKLYFALTGSSPTGATETENTETPAEKLSDAMETIAQQSLTKALETLPGFMMAANLQQKDPIDVLMRDSITQRFLVKLNQQFGSLAPQTEANDPTPLKNNAVGKVIGAVVSVGIGGGAAGILTKKVINGQETEGTNSNGGSSSSENRPLTPEEQSEADELVNQETMQEQINNAPDVPDHSPVEVEEPVSEGVLCKRSLGSSCLPRNEVSESAEDAVGELPEDMIIDGLSDTGAVGGLAGTAPVVARQRMVLLKNARSSAGSISPSSSTANLLPSTRVRWSTFGMQPSRGLTVVSNLIRTFPKAALKMFGVLFDAALPITYGVILGEKLAVDIGRWTEQEPYESGITTADDVLDYFLLFSPLGIVWPEYLRPDTAPDLAMKKIHAIKNEAIQLMAADNSESLSELGAFLDLPLIGSDPNLGMGHTRHEYPDGSVLYALSYERDAFFAQDEGLPTHNGPDTTTASMASGNATRSHFFDQFLLGENGQGRNDFYVITKKTPEQKEEVLAAGSLASIVMTELDKMEKKYISLIRRVNAITLLYKKYVYKTIEDIEQASINAFREYATLNPLSVNSLTSTDRSTEPVMWKYYIQFQTQKETMEKQSRSKIKPVYEELDEPIKDSVFQIKRLEALTEAFFEQTPAFSQINKGDASWQEVRNQYTSFLLTEEDDGYRDEVTGINEEFDPYHRKRIKPHFTNLERENLPVENTPKGLKQEQVLEAYLRLSEKSMANLASFYPEINCMNSTDTEGASNSNQSYYFDVSVIQVPDILKLSRHQQHDAGAHPVGTFHSTYDDVIAGIDIEGVQFNWTSENAE